MFEQDKMKQVIQKKINVLTAEFCHKISPFNILFGAQSLLLDSFLKFTYYFKFELVNNQIIHVNNQHFIYSMTEMLK